MTTKENLHNPLAEAAEVVNVPNASGDQVTAGEVQQNASLSEGGNNGLGFSNTSKAFEEMIQTATHQLNGAVNRLENARHALSGQSIDDVTRGEVVSSEQVMSPGSSTTLREEVSPLQKESKIARE